MTDHKELNRDCDADKVMWLAIKASVIFFFCDCVRSSFFVNIYLYRYALFLYQNYNN